MSGRVLQLFTTLDLGGMERQTLHLVQALRSEGRYEVYVASLHAAGPLLEELRELGYSTVPSFPLRRMYDAGAALQVLRLAALLRRQRIDIVHAHDFYTNVIGMAAASLAAVPVGIVSRRELDVFSPAQRRLERVAYRAASAIAANCDFLRRQLELESAPSDKVCILPNSVDAATLRRRAAGSPDVRASLAIPPGAPLISMLANFHNPRKDPATFIRAASQVASGRPDAVFVIAGGGDPTAAQQLAGGMTPPPRFIAAGPVRDPAPLLAHSDVVVLTSLTEGLPNAVMEAMALGRPVVATAAGGTAELIRHEETGLLSSIGDPAGTAEGILRLLDDPSAAALLGARAHEHVTRNHSPERQSAALHSLYDQLLGSRGWR